ncbi:MAG: FecR domain-containing protein [Anaerohalosphaeraceae bacterium]
MKAFSRDEFELGLLIVEALEGEITPERFSVLEKRLQSDPSAAEQYLEEVMNAAALMWRAQSLYAEAMQSESGEDPQFLAALGEYEKTAPAVEIEPEEKPIPAETRPPVRVQKRTSRFSLAAAGAALAAMVLLLVWLELRPGAADEPAARIADTLGAVWAAETGTAREPEGLLYAGSGPFVLKEGYVRLTYEDGAETVIEGPARFQIKGREELGLSYGQVYVRCPVSATGFTVSTPSMKVIDLGTEFGVKVSGVGSAQVHMLKGKASVIVGGTKGGPRQSVLVQEGQAKQAGPEGAIQDIRLRQDLFARQISSRAGVVWRGQRFDLADAVSGGTGFGGGRPGWGLSVQTGRASMLQDARLERNRPAVFVRTPEHPFIDGVFVPGRPTSGGGVISSTGLRFQDIPFSSGAGFGGVYGGRVEQTRREEYFRLIWEEGSSGRSRPALCFYGNAGLTVDLEAVRRAVPGCQVRTFQAVFGLSPDESSRPAVGNTLADVFVLLDGRVVFEKRSISRFSEPESIEIPFDSSQRFLTLVVMDSGDSLGADWAVFVEPVLELMLEN